jgi:ABC-type uncharacterized transport system ATPase subunit
VSIPAEAAAVSAVEVVGISKDFPGVRAVDHVTLTLRAGEVHCLLGENGAGKSTLMNILAGVYRPDAGEVRVNGHVAHIGSPRDALTLGIGMVSQHSDLVPTLTVLENLMLGQRGLRLGKRRAAQRLQSVATEIGAQLDPDSLAGRLSLGEQQQVEIVKALWRGGRVLILDEPTSMLTPQGVRDLRRTMEDLKSCGLVIVLITHKLREALDVADRISVLHAGRLVGTLDGSRLRSVGPGEADAQLVELMFPGGERPAPARAPQVTSDGAPILVLHEITVRDRAGEVGIRQPLTLTLHAGEVVGVAGVDGNGQRPLAEAIAGQRPLAGGDLLLGGRSIRRLKPAQRQHLGLGYVTDDRLGEGIIGQLDVALNLLSKRVGSAPFWRHGRTDRSLIDEHARAVVRDYRVATPSVRSAADTLSGGTVQKLVIARELSFTPRVVVFSKPTYGLDVRTTADVRARILALVDGGGAAIVLSPDLDELLELCSRVVVLSAGLCTGVVDNGPGAAQAIGALMVGGSA